MISHRLLTNEVCGNGLRNRVTACRKRLRVNRVAERARAQIDSEVLFADDNPVSRFHDYAGGSPRGSSIMAASVVRVNYRSHGGKEPAESEALLPGGEEVGIT